MKKPLFIVILLFFVAACHPAAVREERAIPRPLAKAATVLTGTMQQTESVTATTIYLQKNQLNSPVSGYITDVRVKPGDPVHKGQLLYVIESKEKKALGAWPVPGTASGSGSAAADSVTATYGVFRIIAPAGGIITRMDQQQPGDFVSEGLSLCTIADPATVLFQLNIPYEEIGLVKINPVCRIDLPDGTRLNARIMQPLTQVSPGSQAAPFLARPEIRRFFPEGLIATAILVTYQKKNARLVPAKAVLSDELMHRFWVMQLINDSVAVKVPVIPGMKNDSLAEILQPAFSSTDRVLTTGNYGLADTALVKIAP